ncbi:unnamed protein product [Arabis nemorensis]|uniref:Leucine-rich repeat-containing N-terminal plant-type domain-containing protein n=1 Tax=Arabis nemorensis TaxID=586526 RepID=A0A565BC92_9BRAS|nr:unnamed protein product [Arabis nemorensis]
MKRKVLLGQYLIWVMLLLGKLHGYKSCIQKERKALLELKKYIISITEEDQTDCVLLTWTNDSKIDCCRWEGLKCNRTSGRVMEIVFGGLYLKESSLLNLSLLHPFEELQLLDSTDYEDKGFSGLFDDVEG